MEQIVYRNIKTNNLINMGDTVLVGVSGGHDSMALLNILNNLKDILGFELLVAHVNHGVRGEYALRDENFVKEESEKLGLKFFLKRADMNQYAKDEGISAEEAGRIIRYSFFNDILKEHGGKGKIAVAHNYDDQAETILMRLIRGTGIDGLKSMEFSTANIIRPILNVKREEIENYIESNNIDVVIDHTNMQTDYTRNKIRLELIPYIEKNFNPNVKDALVRLSNTAKKDIRFLDEYTVVCYNKIVITSKKEKIVIDNDEFLKLSENIKSRIIRHIVNEILGSLQGYEEIHVLNVLKLSEDNQTGKQIDLPSGIVCSLSYNYLSFEKNVKQSKGQYSYSLNEEICYIEELDLEIILKEFNINDISKFNMEKKNGRIYIDKDKIKGNLVLRNRRDGDKFTPIGMSGTKKVKDFFIDNKISRELRESIPFIVDDKNIIWIIDYRMSDLYKVDKNTKNAMSIEIKECNNGKRY